MWVGSSMRPALRRHRTAVRSALGACFRGLLCGVRLAAPRPRCWCPERLEGDAHAGRDQQSYDGEAGGEQHVRIEGCGPDSIVRQHAPQGQPEASCGRQGAQRCQRDQRSGSRVQRSPQRIRSAGAVMGCIGAFAQPADSCCGGPEQGGGGRCAVRQMERRHLGQGCTSVGFQPQDIIAAGGPVVACTRACLAPLCREEDRGPR